MSPRRGPVPNEFKTVTRKMGMKRRIVGILGALLLAGCTTASSSSVRGGRAALRPVCGPTDGPAVMLEVPATAQEYPRFRLRVSGTVGELGGREVVVRDPDQSDDPYADWCDGNECRVARGATPTRVSFGPLWSDSSVAARVRTTGPDGKPFAWDGVARWHGARPICG